jgi:hypothetical protein
MLQCILTRREIAMAHIHIVMCFMAFVSMMVHCCGSTDFFALQGPMDLHEMAMKEFMDMRRKDQSVTMEKTGAFMELAKEYAVKRHAMKEESHFSLRSPNGVIDDKKLLNLPAPVSEGSERHLSSAVCSAHGTAMILPEEANAMALEFHEDITSGAVAKAGAFVVTGDNGENPTNDWIVYAEEKLKRENELNHFSLLWEFGSEVAEKKYSAEVANVTASGTRERQAEAFELFASWFEKGGGSVRYAKLSFSTNNESSVNEDGLPPKRDGVFTGPTLVADERIDVHDIFLSVPLKLIMCRQTARNVLIKGKGKYLGNELKTTFEKDEAWGLAIFLLHEYYKDRTGKGSKWGPLIRTLNAHMLSGEVIGELRGTRAALVISEWMEEAEKFMQWSSGISGPCGHTSGICTTKPGEKNAGDTRFNSHQLRWAYWVVKQNAVMVSHRATGMQFLALIPYVNMLHVETHRGGGDDVQMSADGNVSRFTASHPTREMPLSSGLALELDGSVSIRPCQISPKNAGISICPGQFSDAEMFLRYLKVRRMQDVDLVNPYTDIKISIPGVLSRGSKISSCVVGRAADGSKTASDCKSTLKGEVRSIVLSTVSLYDFMCQWNYTSCLQITQICSTTFVRKNTNTYVFIDSLYTLHKLVLKITFLHVLSFMFAL